MISGCPYDPSAQSLAFAFDTTGSMHDDHIELKQGVIEIIDYENANPDSDISNYVLAPFNDPSKFTDQIDCPVKIWKKYISMMHSQCRAR